MKRAKRKLALAVLLLWVVGCLGLAAGCGGGPTPVEEGDRAPVEDPGTAGDGHQEGAPVEPPGDTGGEAWDEESIMGLFEKAGRIEGISYDSIMTSPEGVMESKIWSQGDKFKSETVVQGERMVTIYDGEAMYTYYPQENTAVKYGLFGGLGGDDDFQTALDYSDGVEQEYIVSVEDGSYDGARCKVVVLRDDEYGTETKMWVRTDYGIPVKIESVSDDGYTFTVENKNLQVGRLPADTFQLPAGVEIMDMSDFFQDMMQDMDDIPR